MGISYIVPVFKTPVALRERCRASVRARMASGDEIIEVDNLGLAEARNEGVRRAKGEWIRFVDADDEITDSFHVELSACTADVVLFGVQTRWGEFGKRWKTVPAAFAGLLDAARLKTLNDTLLFRFAWNKVYRRTFLVEHGLAFESGSEPSEDVIFNLKCVLADAKWQCLPKVGYIYWKRMGSSLFRYFPQIEDALRRENALWEKIDGCAGCRWEEEQIKRRVWENRWLKGGEEGRSPLAWRIHHFAVWSRRVLRFVGV